MVWDNQQATSWFCGILEGEGSFHIRKSGSVRIQLHNNDKDIIDECEKFLLSLNLIVGVYPVKAGKKIGYKICIPDLESKSLYPRIYQQMECRRNEYQRMLGASETTCDPTVDLYWLIGMFEAEGCFFISQNHRGHFTPRIELDNTNRTIIKKIVATLSVHNCAWHCKDYVPTIKQEYTKLSIPGMLRVRRFLSETKGLWRSSRNIKRTNLMLEYINSRLETPNNTPYNNREKQIYYEIKQLNS